MALFPKEYFAQDSTLASLIKRGELVAMMNYVYHNDWSKGLDSLVLLNPDIEDVLNADKQLLEFMPELNEIIARNYKDYARQFVAFVHDNGDSLLFINAFCIDRFNGKNELHKKLIFIDDGGLCVWKILYDPKKKVFFDFETH